jgi:DNA-directed RNA polymerase specialized sigma24 family protein
MRYWYDYSYEEIAQELGISMGSIGPTRARCLEKLHKVMQKLEKSS